MLQLPPPLTSSRLARELAYDPTASNQTYVVISTQLNDEKALNHQEHVYEQSFQQSPHHPVPLV